MRHILHDIKRGFLILGFTGPLRSGCTTGAHFFNENIGNYLKVKTKLLPMIERNIFKQYDNLYNIKKKLTALGKISSYELETMSEICALQAERDKTFELLKAYLDLRETTTIIKNIDRDKLEFKYISFTDCLLKTTIENILNNTRKITDKNIIKLKRVIDWKVVDKSRINRINKRIGAREFSKLKKDDFEYFEKYLSYIAGFRQNLAKNFKSKELGMLLQDLGDNARRCGSPIDDQTKWNPEKPKTLFTLAEQANNMIKFYRARSRKKHDIKVYKQFTLEAFRNPYEVEYFRNRYYEFFLFSVFANKDVRGGRPHWDKERDKRDQGEKLKSNEFYKQNVSACVHLSDIAVNNNGVKNSFHRKLSKHLTLITQPGCISPSDDELFMHQAYSMSVMSNCISRQVGAVIVGTEKYIVGAGWNDVGKGQIGCGLRRISDLNLDNNSMPVSTGNDYSDFKNFTDSKIDTPGDFSFCYKDLYSEYKTYKNLNNLQNKDKKIGQWKNKYKITSKSVDELSAIIKDEFSVKRLDYCRALHAEENAILQSAIIGGAGIRGGTIYSTTFPCELCAKKIYQSGIKRVVYTEPYPGSISKGVFFKDGSKTIILDQFEGVKSNSYYRLYKATVDKKEFQVQQAIK